MKKLILSLALICFIGAAKTFAQSSNTKATTPATSAVAPSTSAAKSTTVSGGQTFATPATVKTEAKAETKKSCCSHSSKSCCSSKEGAMKHCSHDEVDKKSENSDSKK